MRIETSKKIVFIRLFPAKKTKQLKKDRPMFITKRNGIKEEFSFQKLLHSIRTCADGLSNEQVNIEEFCKRVANGVCEDMSTIDLVQYTAETAAACVSIHPNFDVLASKIIVHRMHKDTFDNFSDKIEYLFKNSSFISEAFYLLVCNNKDVINSIIEYERDVNTSYFGIKTLEKAYLLKVNGKTVERPQDLFMRVSLQIHESDFKAVKETYDLLSNKYFTHATPTLFNSGSKRSQMSSCFLLSIKEDSAKGIFETLNNAVDIAKFGGGLGINASMIRGRGSPLSTGGVSNGLISMIKVFEAASRFISQCGNKRVSSIAIYLEPWHPEIFEFLDLRKNTGKEELRSRSIFTALWVPDLFMKRVERNEDWTLFCPNVAKGLNDVYGEEFEELYKKYEKENLGCQTFPAQKLWEAILISQIETGTPYILYKDAVNKKNNQKNLGPIKCSNLCAEIVEYTSKDEIAVCNLASIGLPTYVDENGFNFEKLKNVTKVITRNLNKLIDSNFYPAEEAKTSNLKHRPIGIGVQGLADTFATLRIAFDSAEAKKLNRDIFETIYFAALEASNELAKKFGPYESFKGSPASEGILQFDMWNKKPSEKYDWASLKEKIKRDGLRNSLLVALMPTATTSQILGFNECFEPITSNIYARRTLAGEFQVVNKFLVEDLIKIGHWNEEMKQLIINYEGSIQNIPGIPEDIKNLYRTVWEMSMKDIIDMAADRGPFIDQTQSLNIFMRKPKYSQLTSMHFYGWRSGLKTGIYYLRTQPIGGTIKFTVDKEVVENKLKSMSCSIDNPDCLECSS